MKKVLGRLWPIAKSIAAGVFTAVSGLLLVGFTNGFNWKAIAAAAGSALISGIATYIVPNRSKPAVTLPAVTPVKPLGP